MKRLFFVASLAILAAACQKTEIQNEVQTPISFSTETGKQTRAIMADEYADHTFGVYSYAYDKDENGYPSPGETVPKLMDNLQISKVDDNSDWKVAGNTTYYWPNDPDNYLNFYAYSPYYTSTDNTLNVDKTLHFDAGVTGSGITHSETEGLKLIAYTHTNMYVDFMVATPVSQATYTDQNGTTTNNEPADKSVPILFHHELTQVIFNVKTNAAYSGITFTLKEITLNNVVNKADYTNSSLKPSTAFATGNWSNEAKGNYTIFPATKDGVNATPETITDAKDNNTGADTADKLQDFAVINNADGVTTIPVTMIPQTLVQSVTANPDANPVVEAVNGQSFTIKYTISGSGVFNEDVEQTIEFVTANIDWTANKKITYNVVVGLHEITFAPVVVDWDENESYTGYIPETIAPTPSTPTDPTEE